MFRLLIMCLLGLSGIFCEASGTGALPMDPLLGDMMSMTNDAEGMAAKSKRHYFHPAGTPCPQLSSSHSGMYLPPASLSGHYGAAAYQKPVVIPSYHQTPKLESIGYQKPVVPKIIYQTIQRPAIHHDSYNVQPAVKPQVHYVQQQTYMPFVKENPVSSFQVNHHPMAPGVSYENVPKLITNYVKPSLAVAPKPVEKPVMEMQSYYSKQFFQPISYYPKPMSQPKPISTFFPHVNKFEYPTTKVIYQKPSLVSQHLETAGCEKVHQPQVSYVNVHQPIVQKVHQPMFQYAPKYHQPMVQQPMVNYEQKVHQQVPQQPLFHFAQKIHQPAVVQQPIVHLSHEIHRPIAQNAVNNYAQHSVSAVAPPVNYPGHNYQSAIISVNQPCH